MQLGAGNIQPDVLKCGGIELDDMQNLPEDME